MKRSQSLPSGDRSALFWLGGMADVPALKQGLLTSRAWSISRQSGWLTAPLLDADQTTDIQRPGRGIDIETSTRVARVAAWPVRFERDLASPLRSATTALWLETSAPRSHWTDLPA